VEYKVIETNEKLVVNKKVEKTLDRLLEICDPQDIILCGGIVINHYLKKNNLTLPYVIGEGDLDIKIKDHKTLREVLKKAQKDFHITHYHDYSKKKGDYFHVDSFYGVVVDKKNDVKIDIFDIENFVPQELNEFEYKGKKILGRSLEDQIVTKMLETYRILGTSCQKNAIDPKQFAQLYWLVSISDPIKIQRLWSNHPYQDRSNKLFEMNFPQSFEEAYTKTLSFMYHHPEIVSKTIKEDKEKQKTACKECVNDPDFPLRTK